MIDGPAVHPGEPADIWYFAYGSNMCDEVFRVRRMVTAAESVPARLPGYRLAFTLPALPFREPAMASVEPVPLDELAGAQVGAAGARAEGKATAAGDDPDSVPAGFANGGRSTPDGSADKEEPTPDGSMDAEGPGSEDGAPGAGAPSARTPNLPKSHSRTFTCKASNSVCVHGVAHRVTAAQWSYICETEGGAGCADADYLIVDVEVEAYDGRRLQALTLITSPRTIKFNNVRVLFGGGGDAAGGGGVGGGCVVLDRREGR